MKSKIAADYKAEIKRYCVQHGLSYDKLCTSPCCYDDEELIMLYSDPEKEKGPWILDETPMPATLEIYLENGRLRFVQTDITRKYLGVDREAPRPTAVKRPAARRLPSRELATA